MHKASESNWTHVTFGVLPSPMNSSINPTSLSVLRSSLLDLFSQRSNFTLTASIFGQPSSFDIVKFPGGITIIPKQSASIWMLRQALFNFTLPNSIREIEENFSELKEQLKSGLHLKPYEVKICSIITIFNFLGAISWFVCWQILEICRSPL